MGYILLLIIGEQRISLIPILILVLFSLLIIISQWSSTVEVCFSNDFLTVRHLFKSKSKNYTYAEVKSAEHIFVRVYGRRVIFRCIDSDHKLMEFAIYNPDDELLDFVSDHINTYKNKVV
jgi:hypothetical protein